MQNTMSYLKNIWLYFYKLLRPFNPGVLFGLVLLLGAGLRIYDLGTESYWVDEMYTIIEGQQSIPQMIASGRLDQPPGFYIPFHFWLQAFGAGEINTRSFSVVAGILSILIIYIIGRKLFNNQVGLIAAFLMAISAFQIYYSQTTRFYMFFELMALCSFLFYILALSSNKPIFFVSYVISSIILVYSLIFGVWILAAQNIYFFLRYKKHKRIMVTWIICQLLILLAMIPYFTPLVLGRSGMQGAVDLNIGSIPAPAIVDPLRTIVHFILLARGDRSWSDILTSYGLAALLLVIGILIYVSRHGVKKWFSSLKCLYSDNDGGQGDRSKVLLLFCWFLCPILLLYVFSLLIQPMYKDYYTISAAPAFYLLVSLAIFNIRKVFPILISFLVLLILVLPGNYYYYRSDMNQEWKQAAAFINSNAAQNEILVFAGGIGTGIEQKIYQYYDHDALPKCVLGNDLVTSTMKSEQLMKCISGYDRFWVLIRNSTEPSSLVDTYQLFFQSLDEPTFLLIKSRQFIDITVLNFRLIK
jgi:mannosyltransferase